MYKTINISQSTSTAAALDLLDLSDSSLNPSNSTGLRNKLRKYFEIFAGSGYNVNYECEENSREIIAWFALNGEGKGSGTPKKFHARIEFKIAKSAEDRNSTAVVLRINAAKVPFERFKREYDGGTW